MIKLPKVPKIDKLRSFLKLPKKEIKKKILLVEDDAMLAALLAKQLKKEGFEVVEVLNGLDVLETAKTFNPDLVLLDLILPGLDGFEVLRQIKGDDDLASVPVIVLSNLDKESDVKSTIALGADEHLVKVKTKLVDVVETVKRNLK